MNSTLLKHLLVVNTLLLLIVNAHAYSQMKRRSFSDDDVAIKAEFDKLVNNETDDSEQYFPAENRKRFLEFLAKQLDTELPEQWSECIVEASVGMPIGNYKLCFSSPDEIHRSKHVNAGSSTSSRLRFKKSYKGITISFGIKSFILTNKMIEESFGRIRTINTLFDKEKAYIVSFTDFNDDYQICCFELSNNRILWTKTVTPTSNLHRNERNWVIENNGNGYHHSTWLKTDDKGRLLVFGVTNDVAYVERYSKDGKKDLDFFSHDDVVNMEMLMVAADEFIEDPNEKNFKVLSAESQNAGPPQHRFVYCYHVYSAGDHPESAEKSQRFQDAKSFLINHAKDLPGSLFMVLELHEDPWRRSSVANTVGEFGRQTAIPKLQALLLTEKDPLVKRDIENAINQINQRAKND